MRIFVKEKEFDNVVEYVKHNIENSIDRVVTARENMAICHTPLYDCDNWLFNEVSELANDYCEYNEVDIDSMWSQIDEDDIFDML